MKYFSLLAGILLAFTTSAFAQSDQAKPADLFGKLDKNGDGKLVAGEVPEAQSRFFDRLVRLGDADKNGELTKSEFEKATSETADAPPTSRTDGAGRRPGNAQSRQAGAEALFKRFDKNGDGKVAKSELPDAFAQRFSPAFKSLGKDEITLKEFQELRQKAERNGSGQPGGRPGQGQQPKPAEMFKRLDTNGDGKLTIAEAPEQGKRMVAAILERSGKGRDGSLTLKEFEEAAANFARSQQGMRPGQSDRPSDGGGGPAFLRILDANHDGRLSRDELAKAVTLLDRLDRNKDGTLDARELFGSPGQGSMDRPPRNGDQKTSDRPRRPQSEESDKAKDKPRDGQRVKSDQPRSKSDKPRREGRPSSSNVEATFGRIDGNKDGSISRDEAPDRLKDNFDRVDANKDGKVSLEELRKIFERGRGK